MKSAKVRFPGAVLAGPMAPLPQAQHVLLAFLLSLAWTARGAVYFQEQFLDGGGRVKGGLGRVKRGVGGAGPKCATHTLTRPVHTSILEFTPVLSGEGFKSHQN